jgi:K+/H+ antiporter YhaU regulatory subunit KhtT
LERDDKRILTPNPDTVLQNDDLLLVVGEVQKMSYL